MEFRGAAHMSGLQIYAPLLQWEVGSTAGNSPHGLSVLYDVGQGYSGLR